MKIGLFGGTFDPIHWGHLRSAEEVSETYDLDRLYFIPTAIPPHKRGQTTTPARDRLQMVRLEDEGFTPAVIYHSHIDAGAYFSPTDRRQALMNDEPMYPETTYVVVSVVESRVAAVGAFRWSPDARDFVPIDVKPEEART